MAGQLSANTNWANRIPSAPTLQQFMRGEFVLKLLATHELVTAVTAGSALTAGDGPEGMQVTAATVCYGHDSWWRHWQLMTALTADDGPDSWWLPWQLLTALTDDDCPDSWWRPWQLVTAVTAGDGRDSWWRPWEQVTALTAGDGVDSWWRQFQLVTVVPFGDGRAVTAQVALANSTVYSSWSKDSKLDF